MKKLFGTLKIVMPLVLLLFLISCSGSEPTKEPQNGTDESFAATQSTSVKQTEIIESTAVTQSTSIEQAETIDTNVTEQLNANGVQSSVDETFSKTTTSIPDISTGQTDSAVTSEVEQQNDNNEPENIDTDITIVDQKQIAGLLDHGATCTVTLTHDSRYYYSIQVADEESQVLLSIRPERRIVSGIEILDVNSDGYEDIVVINSGGFEGTYELLLWDIPTQRFRRPAFLGFEELRYFEVEDGYVNHWIEKSHTRLRDLDGAGIKQKLVWNGYTLISESEEIITEFPFDTQNYEYRPEPDKTVYKITSIMHSFNKDYRIQLFDADENLQSSVELDESVHQIDFQDVNMDGYKDVVIGYGGALNQPHDLLVWDDSTKSLNEVIYVGFDMLSYFEIYDGYLMCWGKDTASTGSVQKLVWDGNSLVLESEERYETWD